MNLKFTLKGTLSLCLMVLTSFVGWSQTTYTFTNATAEGNLGPTQVMADAEYAGTNLAGNVTVTGGVQTWTVPTTGNYKIECFGGQGYGPFGGRGAHITGEFNLTAGTQFKIVVGQQAGHYLNFPAATYNHQFGGGGGSFVTDASNVPFVVAGGGGGNHATSWSTTADASISTSGQIGSGSITGAGGTGGSGGAQASSADAGGGLTGNGAGIAGGLSFVNGAVGGIDEGTGGFGCGGGTSSWNNFRGGGGGGYSGGGGGNNSGTCCSAGGGGGSYNSGTNPVDLAGVQIGHGLVVITSLQTFPNDAGISGFSGIAPPFCTGALPVSAIVQNYGNNFVTQVSVHWTVNGTVQPPVAVSTPLDTIGGVGLSALTVPLGSAMITGPTTIQVWTVSPNGSSDPQAFNDTNSFSVSPFGVNATTSFNVNCYGDAGGLIQTSTSNSAGTVTYSWSDGSTGQNLIGAVAGTYLVTATNGACTDTSSATITSPPEIIANDATVGVSCFGGSDGTSNLFISGGSPGYTVNWPGNGTGANITNLTGGTHNYTIIDNNGCQTTGSIMVSEPTEVMVTSAITQVTGVNNGSIDVTVSGGTPTYTYMWSPTGQTSEDVSSLAPGTYTVTVTDANGCIQTLGHDVLNVVGLEEEKLISSSIYPNPSNGKFTIQTLNASEDIQIEVFDLLGKKVMSIPSAKTKTVLYLKEREGVYLIKITSGEQSLVKRVVLKK